MSSGAILIGAAQQRTRAYNEAVSLHQGYIERLKSVRILDPACGSGNFLYLSLHVLKDLEHRANLEAEQLGLPFIFPSVGPECVLGIEINPYAAELARVSVWIGEIQWMLRHGFAVSNRPILKPLDNIECRDALLNEDGSEALWPEVDAIIGNPPFLGGKLLITYLGEDYVDRMFDAYDGRVPREADLVCYWFQKGAELLERGLVKRVGLVATNSIRGGANRTVLKHARDVSSIYNAWDDEPWVVDGAAVRVSIVCLGKKEDDLPIHLDGHSVPEIYSDLTAPSAAGGVDLTLAQHLPENSGTAFMGDTKGGAFDISGDIARRWLNLPTNPNGRRNSDVLRPWINGLDLTRRPRDMWIIDFGWIMSEVEAALFEAPFKHIAEHVYPVRQNNRRQSYKKFWWRHVEPRQGMYSALAGLDYFIATPTVAKHRLFGKIHKSVLPDHQLIVVSRDDNTTFGILHSRVHELWSLRTGTWLGVGNDPRYTPTTTFETFPFPDGLTPDVRASDYAGDPRAQATAGAAARLNELRENWLKPPELVKLKPEVVPGFPERIIPVDEDAAKVLKKRTLTNLYNERPTWLENAHRELDSAVAAAYGWPADLSDDEILKRLFELNQERAVAGR